MHELNLYEIRVIAQRYEASFGYWRTYYTYAHSEAEAMADANRRLSVVADVLDLRPMNIQSIKEVEPHRHMLLQEEVT